MVNPRALEVIYITRNGAVAIRLVNDMSNTVRAAGKSLKARYLVAAFDWSATWRCPIWAVYDLRKQGSETPGGDRSLALPEREFVHPSSDGAVMFALALMGGGS